MTYFVVKGHVHENARDKNDVGDGDARRSRCPAEVLVSFDVHVWCGVLVTTLLLASLSPDLELVTVAWFRIGYRSLVRENVLAYRTRAGSMLTTERWLVSQGRHHVAPRGSLLFAPWPANLASVGRNMADLYWWLSRTES